MTPDLAPRSRRDRTRPTVNKLRRRRLFLEKLEDRSLMAVVSYWTANNTAIDGLVPTISARSSTEPPTRPGRSDRHSALMESMIGLAWRIQIV